MNCNDFLLFSLSFNCLKDFWMHVMVSHCFPLQFQWFSMVFNEIQWFSLVLNDGSFRSAETLRNSRRAFKVHNIVIAEEFATSIWYRRASGGLFPSPRFLPPPPFSKWTFNAGWHHDCQTNLSVSCPHLNTGIMGVRHISKDKCALWRRVGGRDTWGGKNSTPDRPPLSNACREFLKACGVTNNQQSESLRNYNVFVDVERFSMIFIVFHRLHSSLNEFQ